MEFEYDTKNLLYVRIDRKRKFLASVFLRALGLRGADEIIRAFYTRRRSLHLKGDDVYWAVGDSLVGQLAKPRDQVPGGEITIGEGKKVTAARIDALRKANVEAIEIIDDALEGALRPPTSSIRPPAKCCSRPTRN